MSRIPIIFLTALLPAVCLPQSTDKVAAPLPPPPVGNMQGGWDMNVANSQAAQWKIINREQPDNARFQLNWLRSEYDARSSSNNGALKPVDKVQLEHIASLIKTNAAGSFEAHMADYYTEFPASGAFADLEAAWSLAPERTELLAPMHSKAMLDGDAAELKKWSRELQLRGGISPALTAAASDLLISVPANAILFTNGDMDTQPAVVQQVQSHVKPGLLIVDQRLLAESGYRKRIWSQAGGSGTVPPDGPGFAKALLHATDRPVYFALSLSRAWPDAFPGQLHAVGAAFRVGPPEAGDAAALEKHWAAMQKPLDAGPMSRNYLMPGAILLAHFRATGETDKATAMEAELRKIAAATGGMKDLEKAGVLKR